MTDSPAITRRQFLQSTAAAIVLTVPATTPMTASEAHSWFQHGVASGDPTTHSVILWTRVTPSVDAVPGSGRGESVTVIWEVAREASISTVIAGGTVVTGPEYDHTRQRDHYNHGC